MLAAIQSRNVRIEIPIKTSAESFMGTVDIKYTDEGMDIILKFN